MRMLLIAVLAAATACGGPGGRTDGDATDTEETSGDTAGDTAGDGDAPADVEPEAGCTDDGDCDDSDPCTSDVCDTDYGTCSHEPTDGDDDGFAAALVGATDCDGDDCDDEDGDVFPGSATRICDGDGDCNGRPDRDNDGDGHESLACGGDDCADEHETAYPGAEPGCGTDATDPLSDLACNTFADSDNDDDSFVYEACTGGSDCDDADAGTHPGADEVCADGIDQDCDDVVDGPEVRIAEAEVALGVDPEVVWNGTASGVTWANPDSTIDALYYVNVPLVGPGSGRSTRITDLLVVPREQSMVWTGSEVGVAWSDGDYGNNEISFAHLTAGGTVLDAARVTDDGAESAHPSLAFSGSEYGVSWYDERDGNFEIYFARLSPDGTKVGSDVRITDETSASYGPSLAWSGSEFAVCWYDLREAGGEIYLARISAAGAKVGSDLRLTTDSGPSRNPSIAWTGSEYGIAWQDARGGYWDIYLMTVSPLGVKAGPDIRLTSAAGDSMFPDLVWVPGSYHLAWADERDGNREIYYGRFDPSGAPTSAELRISNASGSSSMPGIAWTGSELAVVWEDLRDGTPAKVLVSYLTFCL